MRRKRLSANLVRRGNPAEPCPGCGKRVAASRLGRHLALPECMAEETRQHMRLLGYERAGSWAYLVSGAIGYGVMLRAPSRADLGYGPTGQGGKVQWEWWAPTAAVDACDAWRKAPVRPDQRWALVRIAYADPSVLDAARAARRLGGQEGLNAFAAGLLKGAR